MLQSFWLSAKQPLVTVLGYISPYLVSVVQSLSLNQGQLEQFAVAMEMELEAIGTFGFMLLLGKNMFFFYFSIFSLCFFPLIAKLI